MLFCRQVVKRAVRGRLDWLVRTRHQGEPEISCIMCEIARLACRGGIAASIVRYHYSGYEVQVQRLRWDLVRTVW